MKKLALHACEGALRPTVLATACTGTGAAEGTQQQQCPAQEQALQQLAACMARSSAEVAAGDGAAIAEILARMVSVPRKWRPHFSTTLKEVFEQVGSTLWQLQAV